METRDRCPSAAAVLCVHDEIVIEVDAAGAERAREWLVDYMTRGMESFLTRAPVVVDAEIVADWSRTPGTRGSRAVNAFDLFARPSGAGVVLAALDVLAG